MDISERAKAIGDYLKALRKERGLTGAQLGRNIGYTQSHLSGIENGNKGIPTYKFLLSYFSGLGFSYEEFQNHLLELTRLTGEKFESKLPALENNEIINFHEVTTKNKYRKVDYAKGKVEEFNFPINDIQHNFKDFYNVKFWGDRKLSDEDTRKLSDLIEEYFQSKDESSFDLLRNLYQKGEINKETFKEYIESFAPSLIEEAEKIIKEGE